MALVEASFDLYGNFVTEKADNNTCDIREYSHQYKQKSFPQI